jgi:hypothetical protein
VFTVSHHDLHGVHDADPVTEDVLVKLIAILVFGIPVEALFCGAIGEIDRKRIGPCRFDADGARVGSKQTNDIGREHSAGFVGGPRNWLIEVDEPNVEDELRYLRTKIYQYPEARSANQKPNGVIVLNLTGQHLCIG